MYPLAARSAIPRVIGILALVFAPMGIFFSLTFALGPLNGTIGDAEPWQAVMSWTRAGIGLAVLVFAAHLVAGITAVMYKPSAPRWMTIYGIAALVLVVLRIAMPLILKPAGVSKNSPFMEDFVYLQVGYAALCAPWPILALVLMNLRSSKAACRPASAQDLGQVFT